MYLTKKDYNKYDVNINIRCIFIRSTSPSTIVRKNNLFFYRYEWVLILPTNSRHRTMSKNSNPEVTHDKTSINQQEAP